MRFSRWLKRASKISSNLSILWLVRSASSENLSTFFDWSYGVVFEGFQLFLDIVYVGFQAVEVLLWRFRL